MHGWPDVYNCKSSFKMCHLILLLNPVIKSGWSSKDKTWIRISARKTKKSDPRIIKGIMANCFNSMRKPGNYVPLWSPLSFEHLLLYLLLSLGFYEYYFYTKRECLIIETWGWGIILLPEQGFQWYWKEPWKMCLVKYLRVNSFQKCSDISFCRFERWAILLNVCWLFTYDS